MERHPLSAVIVDDEPSVLRILQVALQGDGMTTKTASRGETGLELVSQVKPDFLIVDVRLPGMDGLEVIRRLRQNPETSGTKVLMISAFGEPKGHQADDFLGKPFDIDQLLEKLHELAERTPA